MVVGHSKGSVATDERRVGLLDQVAGGEHVGIGDADHEVARGVAAAGVDQLDLRFAEVETIRTEGKRCVRQATTQGLQDLLGVRIVRLRAELFLGALARLERVLGGPVVGVHRASSPNSSSITTLPRWSQCSSVWIARRSAARPRDAVRRPRRCAPSARRRGCRP